MTRFLVATASVHVTAAAADYLTDRLDPSAGDVVVVGVRESDAPSRDVGDAVNVARARMAAATPTIETCDGDVVEELMAAVEDHDPDEVVIGTNRGEADASGVGETARTLLARLDRPVVVVPVLG